MRPAVVGEVSWDPAIVDNSCYDIASSLDDLNCQFATSISHWSHILTTIFGGHYFQWPAMGKKQDQDEFEFSSEFWVNSANAVR